VIWSATLSGFAASTELESTEDLAPGEQRPREGGPGGIEGEQFMKKWATLAITAFGGATLFQSGCLGDFWQGLWGRGWPTDNLWINVGWDVLNEELFG
jgi:hypothetical protein